MDSVFSDTQTSAPKARQGTHQNDVVKKIAPTGLLNTNQAAELLGIAPATLTIWRSTNRRKLAYVKIGSHVRYRREDLDRFIISNLQNA
ncbi:helix-turn-helix domain-containing protein [Rhodoferax mekongensis]|uniref:helix-turn-helix domain-containing protein n=1 Tax=Rhodoferax mekongensis TaxID=3068341 RepID=UPI0028BF0309|nr:helix-turn-helix domain-containing protein [Rhodoferax sp. TBRC 17199]MDT7514677.1 helix-turn-helix domain-containing protein [Rhodoferax sp. TBRC 17199]